MGYLERNEPRPWTSRTARPPRSSQATSTWTILCSPARTPTLGPCSTGASASRGRLPHSRRAPRTEDVRLVRRYQGYGGTRLQQLAWGAQAGAGGAAAPGRREPADGGRAPPGTPAALRAGRAPGRGTGGGRSCATVNEDAPGARLQPAPAFEQVVGYLERNEPLPLDQPDRKATSFVTSHFYLDDFVQSSEDPNPRPLQARLCIPRKASALPQRPRTGRAPWLRYQGYGGTRFVEDDLAGDPEAGALASNRRSRLRRS